MDPIARQGGEAERGGNVAGGVGGSADSRPRLDDSYYRELFANLTDAVVLLSADDRVLEVNRAFERIFGYADEEACGRLINDLIVPERPRRPGHRRCPSGCRGGEMVAAETSRSPQGRRGDRRPGARLSAVSRWPADRHLRHLQRHHHAPPGRAHPASAGRGDGLGGQRHLHHQPRRPDRVGQPGVHRAHRLRRRGDPGLDARAARLGALGRRAQPARLAAAGGRRGLAWRRSWPATRAAACSPSSRRSSRWSTARSGIDHFVVMQEDISDRLEAERRIHHMAQHDFLTDLPNRYAFGEQLESELDRVGRSGGAVAAMILDLDHFKDINDSYGHARGRRAAGRGGAPAAPPAAQERRPGALRRRRVRHHPDRAGRLRRRQRAGAGACSRRSASRSRCAARRSTSAPASASPSTRRGQREAKSLIKRADMALYRAKADGRDSFRFYEQEMDREVRRRMWMGQELRGAARAPGAVPRVPAAAVAGDRRGQRRRGAAALAAFGPRAGAPERVHRRRRGQRRDRADRRVGAAHGLRSGAGAGRSRHGLPPAGGGQPVGRSSSATAGWSTPSRRPSPTAVWRPSCSSSSSPRAS